ncbi:MAG: ZIP family metal transporter [bacterium]|nr:ZIP family metal transporter [bacterium]
MTTLTQILFSTILVSLISFIGLIFLFLKERILNKVLLFLVAFSAGALMGAAFFDLLPEAIKIAGDSGISLLKVFSYLILGFCAFFILEQFLGWHHHHTVQHPELKTFSYLILVSDGLHNFIDGLIIAGSFLAGFPVGITATLAVIFHEIPKEIGNIGVLLYGGMKKSRALLLNFITACLAILGGLVGFFFSQRTEEAILFLLSFAAGSFIYISASDLIPQIKENRIFKNSSISFLIFLAGIVLIWALVLLLPNR